MLVGYFVNYSLTPEDILIYKVTSRIIFPLTNQKLTYQIFEVLITCTEHMLRIIVWLINIFNCIIWLDGQRWKKGYLKWPHTGCCLDVSESPKKTSNKYLILIRLFQGKKIKLHVFPLTLPTLIFCACPKVFLDIFEQAPVKSEGVPCRN